MGGSRSVVGTNALKLIVLMLGKAILEAGTKTLFVVVTLPFHVADLL